jgi:hypothetical protein
VSDEERILRCWEEKSEGADDEKKEESQQLFFLFSQALLVRRILKKYSHSSSVFSRSLSLSLSHSLTLSLSHSLFFVSHGLGLVQYSAIPTSKPRLLSPITPMS